MNNLDYKTAIAPIVTAGALLYGTVTGHDVPKDVQTTITVDALAIVSFIVTVWGIWKNHQKG